MKDYFTFLMEFKGGTYVSQISAPFESVCHKWACTFDASGIPGFGESQRELLVKEFKSEIPTAVKGVFGVWCVSAMIDDGLAIVHFVKTSPQIAEMASNQK